MCRDGGLLWFQVPGLPTRATAAGTRFRNLRQSHAALRLLPRIRQKYRCRQLGVQDAFRETPTEVSGAAVPAALHGLPADTPVMMYCTGGIRCDIYSAHLRKQGFTCGAGSQASLAV